jgi:hypothetical protein
VVSDGFKTQYSNSPTPILLIVGSMFALSPRATTNVSPDDLTLAMWNTDDCNELYQNRRQILTPIFGRPEILVSDSLELLNLEPSNEAFSENIALER